MARASISQRMRRLQDDYETLTTGAALIWETRKLSRDQPADYSDLLEPHVRARRGHPALIGPSRSLTWGELDAFANRVGHWAAASGLVRGDIVALSMENRPEYIGIWLGLSRVGVATALLNTNLTGDRLAHCMREANAAHWIVSEELVSAAASALAELEAHPKLWEWTGAGSSEHEEERAPGEGPVQSAPRIDAASFDDALAASSSAAIEPALRAGRRGSDLLFLIYTSGTTGLPKAARISHLKAVATGVGAWKIQKLTPQDRTYSCLPLYHSAGGMMAVGGALFSGGALVIARRFSATRFWSDCVTHEVTTFQYIGELCRYLLNSPPHPDERRHRIRSILGNGLRPEVWEPFQERFAIPNIAEFYGATEGNLALFNASGRVGAVGHLPAFLRRAMGVEIVRFDIEREEIVRDDAGRCIRCAPDEAGELIMRINATTRFEGYTNPEATEKKILRDAFVPGDAYFRSGDLLRCDVDGYFHFVDRIGDTFRWKGENVATSEVEEVLSSDAGIDEANVYGVPVPGTDGRAGMAALVTNSDFEIDRLGQLVESELAFYARPLFVRILEQMEITGTFKQRKIDLVREGFDPRTVSDALYVLRAGEEGAPAGYQRLDPALFHAISAGAIRV